MIMAYYYTEETRSVLHTAYIEIGSKKGQWYYLYFNKSMITTKGKLKWHNSSKQNNHAFRYYSDLYKKSDINKYFDND